MFYFSITYSTKEIFRVKNEESLVKWVKVINESTIFCKYWARIEKINKNAHDFLNRQKNIIEIIEENGEIKNFEEELNKKDKEIKQKTRENELKNLYQQNSIFNSNSLKVTVKREKVKIKQNNNKNNDQTLNLSKKISLSIKLIDDSAKIGITSRSFEVIDVLYQYSYGKVYKVKLKNKYDISDLNLNSEFLILKKIKKRDLHRINQLKYVEDEINLIKQCDSPFILKILFSYQDRKNIYMVEELCPGGNLKWHINSNLFEEEEAKFYIAELILAIEHLHKKDFIYKDLKSEKILINEKNHIQLIGYGLTKGKKENNKDKDKLTDKNENDENFFYGVQDEYISPEVLSLKGKDKMADIYGIGVVLYEMVCGTKPFYLKENLNIFNNDINQSNSLHYQNNWKTNEKPWLFSFMSKSIHTSYTTNSTT